MGCGIGVTKANENGSSAAARSQTKYCKCHLPNCTSHHHGRRAQFYHQGVISMAWRTLWSNAAAVGNRHITLPFFACEGSARRHGQAQLITLLAWQLWAKNDVKTSFSFTYKRGSVMNHNGRRSGIVMAHTSWPEDLPHRPVWPNVRALHKAPRWASPHCRTPPSGRPVSGWHWSASAIFDHDSRGARPFSIRHNGCVKERSPTKIGVRQISSSFYGMLMRFHPKLMGF